MTAGAGTASADRADVGSGTWGGQATNRLAPESIAGIDLGDQYFHLTRTVQNMTVIRTGNGEPRTGGTNHFDALFYLDGSPGRQITTMVDHPPAGFELEGVSVSYKKWGPDPSVPSATSLLEETQLAPSP